MVLHYVYRVNDACYKPPTIMDLDTGVMARP
jgi:hypothetical protein